VTELNAPAGWPPEHHEPFDPQETRARLEALWGTHRLTPPMWYGPPLAGTAKDQESVTDNPAWEIFRLLPTMMTRPAGAPILGEWPRLAHIRMDLVATYGHIVPSPADVEFIARVVRNRGHTRVVEVGAGCGYWAWQLSQAGLQVDASDLEPWPRCWAPVRVADAAEAAAAAGDTPLLMVWPPNRDSMAARALEAYRGDVLLFVGEPPGDATADPAFYDALIDGWAIADAEPAHVSWDVLHDSLLLLERRR
jgi:hypothetical protein